MKKLILFVWFLVSIIIVNSQTIIPDSTDVYGTWTKANLPYIIQGYTGIPSGNTLIIATELKVILDTESVYDLSEPLFYTAWLNVKEKLFAKSTIIDIIRFTHNGGDGYSSKILCDSYSENNILDYLSI